MSREELRSFPMRAIWVDRPWGGTRLAQLGKGEGRIGESWEIADLPAQVAPHVADPRSRVAAGPYQGLSLREMIDRHGSDFLGSVSPTPEGDFPLLVKFLDAREPLSVQVHPHAGYVATHPGTRVKTESWYVMDAQPDSALWLDVADGISPARAREEILAGNVRSVLSEVTAITGQFHHLPAGILHALGPGTLVAEVQTPSDTTFRVDDWADLYHREGRDLHLEEAAETLLVDPPDRVHIAPMTSAGIRALVATDHYWMAEHQREGEPIDLGTRSELRILMVVAGGALIDDVAYPVGTTVVIPAIATPTTKAIVDGVVLEIGLGRMSDHGWRSFTSW